MADQSKYNVFVDGAKDSSPAGCKRVADALASRFGLPAEQAQRVVTGGHFRVKRNVEQALARKYVALLEKLGARASVEKATAPAGGVPAAPPPARPQPRPPGQPAPAAPGHPSTRGTAPPRPGAPTPGTAPPRPGAATPGAAPPRPGAATPGAAPPRPGAPSGAPPVPRAAAPPTPAAASVDEPPSDWARDEVSLAEALGDVASGVALGAALGNAGDEAPPEATPDHAAEGIALGDTGHAASDGVSLGEALGEPSDGLAMGAAPDRAVPLELTPEPQDAFQLGHQPQEGAAAGAGSRDPFGAPDEAFLPPDELSGGLELAVSSAPATSVPAPNHDAILEEAPAAPPGQGFGLDEAPPPAGAELVAPAPPSGSPPRPDSRAGGAAPRRPVAPAANTASPRAGGAAAAAPSGFLLLGGKLRQQLALRLFLGVILCVGLSFIPASMYASHFNSTTIVRLQEEEREVREKPPSMRDEIRTPAIIREEIDSARTRGFIVTLALWVVLSAILGFLWLRFT